MPNPVRHPVDPPHYRARHHSRLAFIVYFLWIKVEPIGQSLMDVVTAGMADGSWLKNHLLDSVAHMRLLTMGLLLLLILRFSPRGLLPEK